MDEPTKRCCTCKKDRPLTDYNVRRRAKDGLQSRCRECSAEWYVANRESHKARVAVNRASRRRANQHRLLTYLMEHPCVDCGNDDLRVLDFDHRDPADKTSAVGKLLGDDVPWSRIAEEIAKCEVRCANCHRKRTSLVYGWGRHWAQLELQTAHQERTGRRLTTVMRPPENRERAAGRRLVASGVWAVHLDR